MRRTASEVIRSLEMRIARLEKQSAPRPTPAREWEEFGDNTKRHIVTSVPSKGANDVGPLEYDYDELLLNLAEALSPRTRGRQLFKLMKTKRIDVKLFKYVAGYTEIVPVSSTYPDGGATFILYEAYYTKNDKTFKVYLRVEDMVILGGSLKGGKILTQSQANNFISTAKKHN